MPLAYDSLMKKHDSFVTAPCARRSWITRGRGGVRELTTIHQ